MAGPVPKPSAEVPVTGELVRRLLHNQHPDLADLPIAPLASGWDNALFRVGDHLIARLPRRRASVALVEHEQRWLPVLAPRLPLPIPAPTRTGRPGAGYPWPWSLVPFLPGRSALTDPPDDLAAAADTLAGFLEALHLDAPHDAPENPYRGIPLADRSTSTERWIDQVADRIDASRVRAAWRAAVAVPRWTGPPRWLHGDLHPNNVLVSDGAVSAVIDFGDLTAGDPATDLAVAWMLLDDGARDRLRTRLAVDDATWERGRGWGLTLGLAYLAHSADDPAFATVGARAIAACT